MVKLNLSQADAQFLRAALQAYAARVERELVHTDKRSMQRALAFDAKRIQALREDLDRAIDGAFESASVPGVSTSRELR